MDFETFSDTYRTRVRAYAGIFASKWRLQAHMVDDLEQACWVAVLENLHYWRDQPDGLSPFNFCARSMLRQMQQVLRLNFGMGRTSKRKIENVFVSDEFLQHEGISIDVESFIDLKRAMDNDPKPAQVAKFVFSIINPNEQAKIASNKKQTRQAFYMSVRRTKERLRLAMG